MEMVQKEGGNGCCMKSAKGPWVVHRTTKDGRVVIRHRFPSDRERQNNREREKNRRLVARKIFSGLRAFGNYKLSKNADTIDLLKAVCEEAGWHVNQDGTVYKKNVEYEEEGSYNKSGEEYMDYTKSGIDVSPEILAQKNDEINLTLSLTLATPFR